MIKIFLSFFIFFTLYLQAQDEIRLGVYAFRGYEDTKKKYEPLVAYLNETLHKKVILEVLSQDEMNKKIAAKELDIITTSPIHFLVIRQQHQLSGAVATLVAVGAVAGLAANAPLVAVGVAAGLAAVASFVAVDDAGMGRWVGGGMGE